MIYLRKQKERKRYSQEEDLESMRLAGYLRYLQNMKKVQVYSHVPHETYTTSWNVKRKNKMKGVMPGVPDYIIVINNRVIFLELKKKKGGVVSLEQKVWLESLDNKMTISTVANGFDEAKEFLNHILSRSNML